MLSTDSTYRAPSVKALERGWVGGDWTCSGIGRCEAPDNARAGRRCVGFSVLSSELAQAALAGRNKRRRAPGKPGVGDAKTEESQKSEDCSGQRILARHASLV